MTSKKTASKTPDTLGDERPRSGKWSQEEEAYVDLLIEEFRCGALPLREGTTLRSFLSKMVNCNPKRVSKKYENTNYNGKHKYEPSTIPMSMAEMKRRRERLQEYERRFLRALERVSDDPDLEEEISQSLNGPEEAKPVDTTNMAAPSTAFVEKNKEDPTLALVLQQTQLAAPGSKRNSMIDVSVCSSKRPSLVDGFQGRLAADIHPRMDLANRLSGQGAVPSGASGADIAANMSLTLPSSNFAPPTPTGASKSQVRGPANNSTLHRLATFDFLSSLNKQNAHASAGTPTMCGLPGQLDKMRHSDLIEDPLLRQVRIQQQAAVEQRAQRLLLDPSNIEGGIQQQPFPLQPYHMGQATQDGVLKRAAGDLPFSKGAADLTFPSLPSEAERRRHLRPSALDHLSPLQIASLKRAGVTQGLPTSREVLRGPGQLTNLAPGSSLVSELGMMESLKRDHDSLIVDNGLLRPFKRLR